MSSRAAEHDLISEIDGKRRRILYFSPTLIIGIVSLISAPSALSVSPSLFLSTPPLSLLHPYTARASAGLDPRDMSIVYRCH